MNEVSVVGNLIVKLIAVAIALGTAGTLADKVFFAKDEAQQAVLHQGISYQKWNTRLLNPRAK